jgi:putative membrane protein
MEGLAARATTRHVRRPRGDREAYPPAAMSKAEQSFFGDDARAKAARAVAAVEARTSAEIVLAVRPISGHYRHADYLAGLVVGFVVLLLLLFLPQSFTVDSMPVAVLAGFAIGAVLCAHAPPLRRLLVGPKLMDTSVRIAARAAFVDGGVTRTHGRTGILIFVSIFERRVEVVGDLGIDPERLGEAYQRAVRAIGGSLSSGLDFTKFLTAVEALGPALSGPLPRGEDDENELADAMDVAS